MESLAGLTLERIGALVRECGQPPYRAGQLRRWVFSRRATRYEEMTDLPAALRARLAGRIPVRCTRPAVRHDSGDGTGKLLLELADGEHVECVSIPEGERTTHCLSTQVGCGVGCLFCASGAQGVVRNLDASEIVEQVLWLGPRPDNVVVMGMGEPLHNVAALSDALDILIAPDGLDLGARRITVSTSGPREGFERFLERGHRVKLAISLHAATDELRHRLVPRGGTAGVAELASMAQRWFDATGRDVTFEYVLLRGLNDSDDDARSLAALAGRHRNVNLIPMNPVPTAPGLRAPPSERTRRFVALLERAGVTVHRRRQRGDDVAAACGQLRLQRAGGPGG